MPPNMVQTDSEPVTIEKSTSDKNMQIGFMFKSFRYKKEVALVLQP